MQVRTYQRRALAHVDADFHKIAARDQRIVGEEMLEHALIDPGKPARDVAELADRLLLVGGHDTPGDRNCIAYLHRTRQDLRRRKLAHCGFSARWVRLPRVRTQPRG